MKYTDKTKAELIKYLEDDLQSQIEIPKGYYYAYKLSCRLVAYCEVIDNKTAIKIIKYITKVLNDTSGKK
jgi:hypothetical protein